MGQHVIEMASFAAQPYTAERAMLRVPKAIDFQITIEKSNWYSYRKTSPFIEGRANLFHENKRGNGFNIFP